MRGTKALAKALATKALARCNIVAITKVYLLETYHTVFYDLKITSF